MKLNKTDNLKIMILTLDIFREKNQNAPQDAISFVFFRVLF